MKYITTLLLCVLVFSSALAQQTPAVQNFVLLINGKQYNTNAAIAKSEILKLETAYPEVINLKTNKRFKPVSFQWAISVADSNAVWKAHIPNENKGIFCRTGFCKTKSFSDIVALMKKDDLLFIDDIKFKVDGAIIPAQFSLRPY